MASKTLLVLGAGKNIAAGLTKSFSAAGYRIALVSRSFPSTAGTVDPTTGVISIKADLNSASEISAAFSAAKTAFGAAPRVVVFNAAHVSFPAVEGDLFSIPVDSVVKDTNLMIANGWAAAVEAAKGWQSEGVQNGRFIYTGNILNKVVMPVPFFFTLGVGKSGAAFWVELADSLYKDKGMRFFYADQRSPEGGPAGNVPDGDLHGKVYLELAETKEDLPALVSFAAGKGITQF